MQEISKRAKWIAGKERLVNSAVGGKNSAKRRFEGKTKEEISELMSKVRNKTIIKY